jgi:hypothetical protein
LGNLLCSREIETVCGECDDILKYHVHIAVDAVIPLAHGMHQIWKGYKRQNDVEGVKDRQVHEITCHLLYIAVILIVEDFHF